ncbi:peptidase C12, ubiquitin carboxyl-terminal hydrolase 1 [Coccomyxa subellipsoidea C-169]|uniref:Ubiquitin carboxyl-terminal hydrolase n=1 Tax=Coccomyxa subellipsoidea (strain C-169) TaxID=574566 RepID=I0YY22_COCSC|nr:peptidase C12, ubiquitin carboxyl-terminal hydrolase 1 [Coccomyxa subellipsoidea C-169]EIE23291.1 peptidase C12, ubiquitin carboxyl-terminal hydrolase 1 [Coccomyxa subellipsoidea C-169]|eukprot:XP_005647835.1 peptidase C12, ubiquitin carboxyl-terminal hydrolase 1 [Coccomyxa subellipsoidea C-169]
MGKKWLPLESNPDVLNDFTNNLGLDVSKHSFHDVYGLDEELLAMVPQPVLALLLLFPITKESEAAKEAEDARLKKEGYAVPEGAYFMKQTIGNACGTIGALHAIANTQDKVSITDGSFLERFLAATAELTAEQRGKYLEEPPPGAPDLDEAHQAAAQEGDTAPPSLDEVVDLHFVALVESSGRLLELDGRKSFPIDHGPTSSDDLLKDAAMVAKEFMDGNSSISFNLIAFAATPSE